MMVTTVLFAEVNEYASILEHLMVELVVEVDNVNETTIVSVTNTGIVYGYISAFPDGYDERVYD